MELEKTYNPSNVESKWYEIWQERGAFAAKEEPSERPAFSIVIPPPNITGQLTLGHVLNNTLQDILVRKKRMEGFDVLWMPGTDHAGIATQNVVEKALAKDEKKSRHDLGREEFLKRVWAWREKYGSTIISQLKRLGCSCDWGRLRFTLDRGYSDAVQECFVRLYEKGLIYQGKRIINWCPRCRTALSDEENIHKDKQGKLWHIRYPLAEGSGGIVVATTRPETMLGDTAVAVNPKDSRYAGLVGNKLLLPLANREIPIVADDGVDMEFGTGCVKITPAHDPNDFATGVRHNLAQITVMAPDATMNENAPEKYRGLDRFACRKAVIADLEALGLLVEIKDHAHSVGHCERCETVTEPYLSKQWFVRYDPWVAPSLEALKSGSLNFYPDKWGKTFEHWMANIRDWCISRQLWWGHRIPAWYCGCGEIMVTREKPEKCRRCGGTGLSQDDDVLDTWFSSWLWPLATMGWPENTELLKKYYPTSALITGPDIIFFWVARMIFAGLEFRNSLPFKDVYFTSIVRDMQGRKMSKSLGNSPDPIAVMDKYGTDALRYTVISLAPMGQDVLFSEEKCELGRNFANKLWNTARFVLMTAGQLKEKVLPAPVPAVEDGWLVSRYQRTVKTASEQLDGYNFNAALDCLYHFVWNDLCDWYVEFVKPRFSENHDPASKAAGFATLITVYTGALKLLHPYMPFITEEIYSVLKTEGLAVGSEELLITASWPVPDRSKLDPQSESKIEFIRSVITAVRTLRAEKNIPPAVKGDIMVVCDNDEKRNWLFELDVAFRTLSKTGTLAVKQTGDGFENAVSAVVAGVTVFLNLEGLVDKTAEADKIKKEIARSREFLSSIEKKLSNDNFVKNAPPAVIDKEKQKVADTKEKLEKLEATLNRYS